MQDHISESVQEATEEVCSTRELIINNHIDNAIDAIEESIGATASHNLRNSGDICAIKERVNGLISSTKARYSSWRRVTIIAGFVCASVAFIFAWATAFSSGGAQNALGVLCALLIGASMATYIVLTYVLGDRDILKFYPEIANYRTCKSILREVDPTIARHYIDERCTQCAFGERVGRQYLKIDV
jgi:hypothetical protein